MGRSSIQTPSFSIANDYVPFGYSKVIRLLTIFWTDFDSEDEDNFEYEYSDSFDNFCEIKSAPCSSSE